MNDQVIAALGVGGGTSAMVAEQLGMDVDAVDYCLRRLYGSRCRRVGDRWYGLEGSPSSALNNLATSGAAVSYGLNVSTQGRTHQ